MDPDEKSKESHITATAIHTEAGKSEISEDFPEGGLAGWATVVGAFLAQFCGFGYATSFGVYQDFYTRTYITNRPPSTISWIGSLNAFLVVSCGLVAGRLYDRGYFYHLVYGGSLLISFSLFMLSCAKPDKFYQVFLSQGLGAGLGAGIMAMVMSIIACGSSLGAVIHPIMLNNTLNGRLGFANAARANAGMISGLLFIACLLMRPRIPPSQSPVNIINSLKKFSRDWAYVASIAGSFFFLLGYYYPLFYFQLDAIKHGLSATFAFYTLVIMSFSSLVGRLSSGILVRRLGVTNMIVVSTGCCSVMIFGVIGLKSTTSVVILAILNGFFAGTVVALMAPLMAILSDDISEIGARMGVGFAISGIGVLVGPPINGALLGDQFMWWKPATFSGFVSFLGFLHFLLMLVLLRQRQHRMTPKSGPTTQS